MTKKSLKVVSAKNCPDVNVADLTDCHVAKGGAGYERALDCAHKCPDKFSCLSMLVEDKARNVVGLTLDSDSEVAAVLSGEMAWGVFVARYNERMEAYDAGKPCPAHLAVLPAEGDDVDADEGDDVDGDEPVEGEGGSEEDVPGTGESDDESDDESDEIIASESGSITL